jgi:hypothetical protein
MGRDKGTNCRHPHKMGLGKRGVWDCKYGISRQTTAVDVLNNLMAVVVYIALSEEHGVWRLEMNRREG